MKLAIMQPYFLPYIGYWQLIHVVDKFVLLDDVQFIRHGWINRNRVLKHGGGWQYITVPLRNHSMDEVIKNIYAHNGKDWKTKILRQLEHYNYGYNNKAPFYCEVIDLLKGIFSKISNENLTGVNALIIKEICCYLGIKTQVLISSDQKFNYECVQDAGEWALRIAEQMNVQEYINPMDGAHLFAPDKFRTSKIKLSFLKTDEIIYDQGKMFEPNLSIVDVLMFNGQALTQNLLNKCSIVTSQ
jgi:hypothetical protein